MSDKRKNIKLVIDTNIAQSYSESTNARSIACRAFLNAVRDLEYRIVMSPDLAEEWKRHRSRAFVIWLKGIYSRKLQYDIEDVENASLREKISQFAPSDKDRQEMLKDVLLLEAALVTDERIASMNELDRERFQKISRFIKEIQNISWVNPEIEAEKAIEWLENNAPIEAWRQLGYQTKDS